MFDDNDNIHNSLAYRVTQLENGPSHNIEYEFDGTDLEITAVANNGVFELDGTTLLVTITAS